MKTNHFLFVAAFSLLWLSSSKKIYAQESVLSSGKWVKMEFEQSGVYKISYTKLKEMGFDAESLNPKHLAIFGNPGGMLPQGNSEPRPIDLMENAIKVIGESDESFDETDYLLFYVDQINPWNFDSNTNSYSNQKNLFSNFNYYFLTVKNTNGKRIEAITNLISNSTSIDWYEKLITYHEEEINLLNSGREWFGDLFNNERGKTYQFDTDNFKSGEEIKVDIQALGQSFSNNKLNVEIEGTQQEAIAFNSIPNTQYGVKGDLQKKSFVLPSDIVEGTVLEINLNQDQADLNSSRVFLDYINLTIPERLEFNGEQFEFRNSTTLDNSTSRFRLSTSIDVEVWNITNTISPREQETVSLTKSLEFEFRSSQLQQFVVFDPELANEPEVFSSIENQNLHSPTNAEYIIITHSKFLEEAQRLASHRRIETKLISEVVTTSQIYNEFSSGRQDITAIRDFIKHRYDHGDLKYVLLFGKGSYDYKDRIPSNSNFVPTYESRNSIHPLLSYSSDDFFGFLDDNEGLWTESRQGDHQLNIGIGRIPATSIAQAKTAVDKIIQYELNPEAVGDWRKQLVFIADDGDRNIHQRDAEIITNLVNENYSEFNVDKIYLDSYEQVQLPNGQRSPSAESDLLKAVNDGALIMNFTGHGSENGWMQERILTQENMNAWRNLNTLPFVITATCEFGRNDDPDIQSGAEFLLFKNDGGAIGLITTARPVFSSTNFRLNRALFDILLERQSDVRLGDIVRFTKNNSLQGSLNRNFTLLGDPALKLAYPKSSIQLESLNSEPWNSSTIVQAMQPISIQGVIQNNQTIDSEFNGTVQIDFFDKLVEKSTKGNESDPTEFREEDALLFTGAFQVIEGRFEINFTIPKFINYELGEARISLYAYQENSISDAIGSSTILLGGTFNNPNEDNSPPEIKISLENSSKSDNAIDGPNADISISLRDESGINISNQALGQNIVLVLNDSVTFDITDSFSPTFALSNEGVINYTLNSLKRGPQSISVSASDIFGNRSNEIFTFRVESNSKFINKINASPNPLSTETHFIINHSLIGENLEVKIEVYDLNGERITTLQQPVNNALNELKIPWKGNNKIGQPLTNGVYIYNVEIYSNSTNKRDNKRSRLIISN